MQKELKLIAILPPEPVFTEIRQEQESIAATWGPRHALRTPPHITIIPPLLLSSGEVGWLYGMAYALASSVDAFRMELKDYNSFKPRVVYIHPKINAPLVDLFHLWHEALKVKMPHVLEKYPERPYQPHITLAHKDVTHAQFDKMWSHYATKHFQASFLVDRFHILTHGEEGWTSEREYFLKK